MSLREMSRTTGLGPRLFLMIAAVLVGLANASWFATLGGNQYVFEQTSWSDLLLVLLAGAGAGFLTSELLLRVRRPALEAEFFPRYVTIVLAVCLGGVLLGVLLPIVQLLLDGPLPFVGLLVNPFASMAEQIPAIVSATLLGAFVGGVLGVLEGLILGFPLGLILGRFRGGRNEGG